MTRKAIKLEDGGAMGSHCIANYYNYDKEKEMEFTLKQAKTLLEMFGGEEAHITVAQDGETLKAYHTDYPEEGSIEL